MVNICGIIFKTNIDKVKEINPHNAKVNKPTKKEEKL
tara:strand:- start:3121 stop:3231 length:111 start_codon:yes stop_codon:yes gene_type:complete